MSTKLVYINDRPLKKEDVKQLQRLRKKGRILEPNKWGILFGGVWIPLERLERVIAYYRTHLEASREYYAKNKAKFREHYERRKKTAKKSQEDTETL